MGAYLHLLQSFIPKSDYNQDVISEFSFPLDIQEKATEEGNLMMVDTCCGVTDSGNPFPCDNGNCTWWVYYKMNNVPFTGNAYQWGRKVAAGYYPGWVLVEDPVVGYIAWWDISTSRPYGHVAYVVSKSGYNTWVKVSEMTWQGNPCSSEPVTKTITLPSSSEPTGYIVQQ